MFNDEQKLEDNQTESDGKQIPTQDRNLISRKYDSIMYYSISESIIRNADSTNINIKVKHKMCVKQERKFRNE